MSDDLKGTVFNGRYTILEKIGAGGMATVYRARDEESSRFVAVKILSREFLDRNPKEAERNLRRFKREADILKLLDGSPHVVGFVEHACSEAGDWFIAMELLEGEQLSRSIGRGKDAMRVGNFLHYGVHLVLGLKEIHSKNIVHRDLAPDNVIIVKDADGLPLPKFLDFGIGKSLDDELDQVTQMLTIMGKPQYFSPEQARGVELTSASDVYSLGVVLYQLVTGHVPLEIRGIPDFKKIQKEQPIPIQQYREGQRIPEELQDVITRCLAKAPEDRPLLDEVLSVLEDVRARANAGEQFATRESDTGPTADYTAPVRITTELDLAEGAKVNRYEIARLLGRGGMGAVYEAWDPQLQRKVALKVATQIEEQEARNRLLKEARASAALRCENIVTIYDVGTDGGTPFIAMEFVDGKTLAQVIEDEGPLSGHRFWEIASGLCEGLHVAHDRTDPVVHRDLKPGNVLVHRHVAKIMDFGIAKIATGGAASGADTGGHDLVGGTASTMSPEQINEREIDHRSDLYSLGCVLYMMATGRGPFRGNQIAIIYQHCNAEPTAPSKIVPGIPTDLDRIILKLLEKEPDDRYGSATEVLEDLRAVYAPQEQVVKPWYKSPLPIAACVAILAAIITLVFSLGGDPGGGGGASRFAVNFVGAQGFSDGRTYYTSLATIKLGGVGPTDGRLEVVITPEDGDAVPQEAVTFSERFDAEFALLPLGAEARRYTVTVGLEGSDETPLSFTVVQDPSDPVVSAITHGGMARVLVTNDPIYLLHDDDVIIEVSEPDSGFGDPQNPTTTWRSDRDEPIDGIELSRDGDVLKIRVTSLAGGGTRTEHRILRRIPSLAAAIAEPWTASNTFELALKLECEPFDIAAHPLADGDVVAILGDQRVPLEHRDGTYRGSLDMPAGEAVARTHQVTLEYRGRSMGDPISIIHDPVPPVVTLTYAPAGGERAEYSVASPPAQPLDKRPGEKMETLFVVTATDGDRLRKFAQVTYGDKESRDVLIGENGKIVLLGDSLPTTPDFDVIVKVTDRAGNSSELQFKVNQIGINVSNILVDGRSPIRGGIWVQDPDDLSIRVDATGTTPRDRLLIAVVDANENPVGQPSPMKRVGNAFEAAGVDLGATGTGRSLVVVREGSDGRRSEIARYVVAVDSSDPTFTTAVHGTVVTLPATVATSVFPTLQIRARDDSGSLDARAEDVTVEGAGVTVQFDEVEGGANWLLSAPPDVAGSWTVRFRTRDHSGRSTQAMTLGISVAPPEVFVAKAGPIRGAEPKRRQFVGKSPIPIKDDFIDLDVGHDTDATLYLRATLLPSGKRIEVQTPIEKQELTGIRIHELAGDAGTIQLEWYERVSVDAVSPATRFDEIKWVRDRLEPTWALLRDGVPVTDKTRAQLASEGLKITQLDAIALRIKDDGGFARNPILATTSALPAHEPVKHLGKEITWSFKAEANWTSKTVDIQIQDLAGHIVPIRFSLHPALDDPQVAAIRAPYGSLNEADGQLESRAKDITIELTNDAEDVAGIWVEVLNEADTVVSAAETPFSGERGSVGVSLPSDGKFQIRLTTVQSASGRKDAPFKTLHVRVDSVPPTLTIKRANAAVGATLEVPEFNGFTVEASDRSGIRTVEYAVGPNDAPLTYRTCPLSSGSGNLYRIPDQSARGRLRLAVRATDLAGNSASASTLVIVEAAAPPPVTFSARKIKDDFGIDVVEVEGTRTRPTLWVAKTELTRAQMERICSTVDIDAVIARLVARTDLGARVRRLERQHIEEALEFNRSRKKTEPVGWITGNVALFLAEATGGRLPTALEWRGFAGHYRSPGASHIIIELDGRPVNNWRRLMAKPYGIYKKNLVPAAEASTNNHYGIIGLAGNVSEWVTGPRGPTGALGGSYDDAAQDAARLDRPPVRQRGDAKDNPHFGVRIVWTGR